MKQLASSGLFYAVTDCLPLVKQTKNLDYRLGAKKSLPRRGGILIENYLKFSYWERKLRTLRPCLLKVKFAQSQ